jgi:hypothetical protein
MPTKLLVWQHYDDYDEALLGTPNDGVRFELTYQATCYRRGRHKLLIEVCGSPAHHLWGCFDEADQPLRYYHYVANALLEAEAIAQVLQEDRRKAEVRLQQAQQMIQTERTRPA